MARRPTLKDVADHAGVGVATVDRVLNARAPVARRTAERVLAAAEALDYHAHPLMRRRLEGLAQVRRFGFVLQKQGKWFYQQLAEQLTSRAGRMSPTRIEVDIQFVDALSPQDLSDAIAGLSARCDAIGAVSIDHPVISAAIDDCANRGIPVIALVSPLNAPRTGGYVGCNGRAAGRTAGWAMTRLMDQSGEVGILVGSHRYIGQEAREVGFRSYLRENAPGITLRESIVYLDDPAVAYEAALELLSARPDLSGLYHCGGGVGGVIRALSEIGRAGRLRYICHETSPAARQGLLDGTVDLAIETPIGAVAKAALSTLNTAMSGPPKPQADRILDFRLVTPENL